MVDERTEEERVEAARVDRSDTPPCWLEDIYREDAGAVLQAAYRVTGNAADAEDVLQTVFMRLARRARPPDFATGSRAYLRRAATNAALDIVQSRRVRDGLPLESSAGHPASRDPGPTPERLHLGRELEDRLRLALAVLSRRSAEIFVLRYFEGLDNQEIADQLGTSANTVAVTLHRARERVRQEMEPHLGGTR